MATKNKQQALPFDVVLVEWVDSKGPRRWEYLDEVVEQPPAPCIAAGLLVESYKGHIVVAIATGSGQVLGRTTIPRCCIQSMEVLRHKGGTYGRR